MGLSPISTVVSAPGTTQGTMPLSRRTRSWPFSTGGHGRHSGPYGLPTQCPRDSSWEQRDTRRDSPGMKGSLWRRRDWGKPWIGFERQKDWDSGGGVGRHLRQTSCQALWRGRDSTCVFQLPPRQCPCGVMSPSPALLLLVLLRCP